MTTKKQPSDNPLKVVYKAKKKGADSEAIEEMVKRLDLKFWQRKQPKK